VGLDLQLRVAHKLTPQLRREVVVGSTNIGDPHQFIRVRDLPPLCFGRVYALNFPTSALLNMERFRQVAAPGFSALLFV